MGHISVWLENGAESGWSTLKAQIDGLDGVSFAAWEQTVFDLRELHFGFVVVDKGTVVIATPSAPASGIHCITGGSTRFTALRVGNTAWNYHLGTEVGFNPLLHGLHITLKGAVIQSSSDGRDTGAARPERPE